MNYEPLKSGSVFTEKSLVFKIMTLRQDGALRCRTILNGLVSPLRLTSQDSSLFVSIRSHVSQLLFLTSDRKKSFNRISTTGFYINALHFNAVKPFKVTSKIHKWHTGSINSAIIYVNVWWCSTCTHQTSTYTHKYIVPWLITQYYLQAVECCVVVHLRLGMFNCTSSYSPTVGGLLLTPVSESPQLHHCTVTHLKPCPNSISTSQTCTSLFYIMWNLFTEW